MVSDKRRPGEDFWLHVAFVAFVGTYFAGLLYWFGGLFVTGGAPEKAVMSVVVPVVALLAGVAVIVLSIIVFEGRNVRPDPESGASGRPESHE